MSRVALAIPALKVEQLVATVAGVNVSDAATSVLVYTDAGRTAPASVFAAASGGSALPQPVSPDQHGQVTLYVAPNATYYWTAGALLGQCEAVQAIPGFTNLTVNAAGGLSLGQQTDGLSGAAGLFFSGSGALPNSILVPSVMEFTATTAGAQPLQSLRLLYLAAHLTGTNDAATHTPLYAESYNDQTAGLLAHQEGSVSRSFITSTGGTTEGFGAYGHVQQTGAAPSGTLASVWGAGATISAGSVSVLASVYGEGPQISGGAVVSAAYGGYFNQPVGGVQNIGLFVGNGPPAATQAVMYLSSSLTGSNLQAVVSAPYIFNTGGTSTAVLTASKGGFNVSAGLGNVNLVVHLVQPNYTLALDSNVALIAGLRSNLGSLAFSGIAASATAVAAIYIDPVAAGTNRYGILQAGTDLNSLSGPLNVAGTITASGQIVVVGNATFGAASAVAVSGPLSVTGTAQFSGGLGVHTPPVHLMDLSGTALGSGDLTGVLFSPAIEQQGSVATSVAVDLEPTFRVDTGQTSNNLVALQVRLPSVRFDSAGGFLMGMRANLGSLSFIGADGTCANVAAVYIDPVAAGTNRYGIYQAGTNPNLFGGNLQLASGVNVVPALGGTGTQYGTIGGAAGQKQAFWGAAPVVQPLLATGAGHTVDDVIAWAQSLGLARQA